MEENRLCRARRLRIQPHGFAQSALRRVQVIRVRQFRRASAYKSAAPNGGRPLCPGICPLLRADAAVSMSYTGRMFAMSAVSFRC